MRSALGSLGLPDGGDSPAVVEAVTRLVYADVDASVLLAARQTVTAQLAYQADRSTAG